MAEYLADAIRDLQQYLGQRISVVTRSNNRFEGNLRRIYPEKETIALERVRFCGTENRKTSKYAAAQEELYSDIKLQLKKAKEIFAHIQCSPEVNTDPAIVERGEAVTPILWATACLPNGQKVFVLPSPPNQRISQEPTAGTDMCLTIVGATEFLKKYLHEKPHATFITATNFRYEGRLKNLDSSIHTISLSYVRFFGTEERPAMKQVPPRPKRYHSVKFFVNQLRKIRLRTAAREDLFGDDAVVFDKTLDQTIPVELDAAFPLPIALQRSEEHPLDPGKSTTPSPVLENSVHVHEDSGIPSNPPVTDLLLSDLPTTLTASIDSDNPKPRKLKHRDAAGQSKKPAKPFKVHKKKLKNEVDRHQQRAKCSVVIQQLRRLCPENSEKEHNVCESHGKEDSYQIITQPLATGTAVDGDRDAGQKTLSTTNEAAVFDIVWANKRLICPVPQCKGNLAKNMYTMECHFIKHHRQQYPRYELRLCCGICREHGFRGQIPLLREHMEDKHGILDGRRYSVENGRNMGKVSEDDAASDESEIL